MKLAAIDVGSNSIHLMIVRVLPDHSCETIYRDKAMVRLGAGTFRRGQLSIAAQRRALSVLERFARVIQTFKVDDTVGVATSAVREASNGLEFLREVRRRTGLRIHRISGQEEARLVGVAVGALAPFHRGRWLVVDIGGGSTELAGLEQQEPRELDSLKLGCVRLAERVPLDDPPGKKGIKQLRRAAREEMGPFLRRLATRPYDGIVGTSGTIVCLSMLAARRAGQALVRGRTFQVSRALLEKELGILAALPLEKRRHAMGDQAQRADVILAGGAVLLELIEPLKNVEVHVPDRSIRDGMIVDYVQQRLETTPAEHELSLTRMAAARPEDRRGKRGREAGYDPHLLRERTLVAFARRYQYEATHAHQVMRLAAELFDATQPLHGLGADEKFLLEAAAILHDVGQYIAYSQHHKHSLYLIRNGSLPGFNEREIQIIASVARYHRKALPTLQHPEFAELAPEDRRLVRELASLLRIADGLDYGHLSSVDHVTLEHHHSRARGDSLMITARAHQECVTELERARRKSDLLAAVYGLRITLQARVRRSEARGRGTAGIRGTGGARGTAGTRETAGARGTRGARGAARTRGGAAPRRSA